ncbi:MAG: GMC family oxidoreductase N-terminal domain-containing protein [Actinomycetota bacterium]|nr:GMC family oxidoreductase N-terminal domain-containing protein [Actinomycetota bacterium]
MASDRTAPREVQRVLAALGRGIVGDAYTPELPARMLKLISQLPSTKDRDQLLNALKLADSKFGAAALTGKATPVSWLTQSEAETLIQRWKSSPLLMHRRLAKALIPVALTSTYGHPSQEWSRIGYEGPLGPPPNAPRRLQPIEVTSDHEMNCDVVVVGSGAGGGCVAAGLAAKGLDVIVVEKGAYHNESDFHHNEPEATRDMYLYGLTLMTKDLGCRIVSGSTLGGGTVVNYTTSFKTPDYVLKEWARLSGMDAFVSGEFDEALDEAARRLNVNTDSSAAGRRDQILEEGLKALGWHVDNLPRAVRGCTQDEACGYCGFGCRVGAKQSSMRTYLEDAAADGARFVTGADVERVNIVDGRATGVSARVGPHRLVINSSAVVSSAGAIESPALLLRSGLGGRVGYNLHLHPGTASMGIFDDDVRIWEGTLQARYSNEFTQWDGGYGPLFETVPVHPGAGSTALPWQSIAQHHELMGKFKNLGFVAVLPRDKTSGRVTLTKDGAPSIEYRLRKDDDRRIAEGVIKGAQLLEAAGARQLFSLHPQMFSYKPGPGAHDRWADQTRAAGYGRGKATLVSYHQMGSCSIGTDPSTSVVGPDHETHQVRNLFVIDASNFPTASGVNPMLSIYGFAVRAARKIADRLT